MTLQELVVSWRSLRRTPGFTLSAIVTIALGIGATTAVFSVANAALLRPLPYADPARLVVLYGDIYTRALYGLPFSNENFVDIRRATTRTFDGMTAVTTGRQVVTAEDGTPEEIRFARVTTDFFQVMGGTILLGRDFAESDGEPQPPAPAEGATSGTPPSPSRVILSYDYWRRRFGGDGAVLGQLLPARGTSGQQIVGVLAPGFELLFPPADNIEPRPDIWIASRAAYNNAARNGYALRAIGRLKPGATLVAAQTEAESAAAAIRANFPLFASAGFHVRVAPMHDSLVKPIRPAILALMGAALFLLLIACANVANLILVRASMRTTELAVRTAIGAGRWRLVRYMLSESLLLSVMGAGIGVGLAWIGVRRLLALAATNMPRLDAAGLDPIVLACAAGLALAATLALGLAPVYGVLSLNVSSSLRGSGRAPRLRGSSLVQSAVVVAEVTLCFVLLVGSALMLRSFVDLQRTDIGFDTRGLLTFRLLGKNFDPALPPAARDAYIRQVEERLRAVPGVQRASGSYPFPLTGDFTTLRWGTEEALSDNTRFQSANWQSIRPGYLEAIGARVLAGRTFAEADNDPRRALVVIDDQLAAKAFAGASAVGKRLLIRIRTPEPEWAEVIGVVAHQRLTSLAEPGREQVFLPDGYFGFGARNWAIRTAGRTADYAQAVRAALRQLDPNLLVTDIRAMDEIVWRAQAGMRFTLALLAVFTVIAAMLVCVGLYGVLSTTVRQRTSEIGVRMALGAAPASILQLVLTQGLRLCAVGIAIGVLLAIGLNRVVTTLVVGVQPAGAVTFVAIACVFLIVAAASCWLPARRASALDPAIALRDS